MPDFAVSCRAAAVRVAGYDARDRDIDLSGVFVEDAELQAASQRFLRARADASWPNRPRGAGGAPARGQYRTFVEGNDRQFRKLSGWSFFFKLLVV